MLRTPIASYLALTFLFSLSFLVSGVVEIYGALSERATRSHWGWALAGGIFDLLIGVMLFNNPEMSVAVLPFVVGFGLLLRSSFAVAGAFALKSAGGASWGTVMFFGVLGVVAGFVLLRNPLLAGLTIVVWTGISHQRWLRAHHGGSRAAQGRRRDGVSAVAHLRALQCPNSRRPGQPPVRRGVIPAEAPRSL